MKRPLLVVAALGAFSLAGAADRIPIEDFAKSPAASRLRLSPDGQRVAFLRDYRGYATLHFIDFQANRLSQLDLGEATLANDATKSVGEFSWIGDKRLVATTYVWGGEAFYGVIAVDWNGGAAMPVSGYEDNKVSLNSPKLFAHEVVHTFSDESLNVLLLDRHESGGGSERYPDILRIDTMLGTATTVVKNPGDVTDWAIDFDGVARLGIQSKGDLSGAIFREDAKAPWRTILPLENRTGQIHPIGFDAGGGRILVSALTKERRWTIFPLDPGTGHLGEPLLADPEYDIVPVNFRPSVDAVPLVGPIFSLRKKTLVGVRYYTEAARIKWFDRDYAALQAIVDHSLPDTVNIFVDESRDGKRSLWFSFSDRNPGDYSLLDVEKRSFKLVAKRYPNLDPARMAPTLAVKYPARDGLLIHGYLTVPVGYEPKNLPLVVLPHGGPWVRDVWGFDPLVQLLAGRGYAVLQMNYRGSPGYGDTLYRTARHQIGGAIQDDIEDGTRWAIGAGVADPKRIAMAGASYGGYSTFFALGHNQDNLYRCGISLAGVTDWLAFFEDSDIADYKVAKRHWRNQLGDPENDKEKLKAISPVNFAAAMTAPLLIIQGRKDQRVPPDQAKRMIAALEKAGHKPESLFLPDVGHEFGNEKRRIEIYTRIVDFLERNLGPGVPAHELKVER